MPFSEYRSEISFWRFISENIQNIQSVLRIAKFQIVTRQILLFARYCHITQLKKLLLCIVDFITIFLLNFHSTFCTV
jgi:hypothetical protein